MILPSDRVDPELRASRQEALAAFPGGVNNVTDLVQRRAITQAIAASSRLGHPALAQVSWSDRLVASPHGSSPLRVRVYRPHRQAGTGAAILFLHSGGMILGDLEFEHVTAASLCEEHSAVVVSVDYRLAPETPYPGALHDCLDAWRWLRSSAAELGVDVARTAFYGQSAGGGLAVATSLLARDSGDPLPGLVMAICPMLDDRPTPSSLEITELGVWDSHHNQEGWRWYLGGQEADQYAAPARALHLSGLPPTFIDVGELDVFRDEDIAFAQRLLQDGVPTELHVYPGAFHGSDGMAPDADVSRRTARTRREALERVLGLPGSTSDPTVAPGRSTTTRGTP